MSDEWVVVLQKRHNHNAHTGSETETEFLKGTEIMPELCEVENYRRILLKLCLSSTSVLSVETPSTAKEFLTQSEKDIIEQCVAKDVERKGKLLRIVLSKTIPTKCNEDKSNSAETTHLYFHFGMTGRVSTPECIPSLESLKQSESFPPHHSHLIFKSKSSKKNENQEIVIAYSDPRKFGKVALSINGEGLMAKQWLDLSPDALDLSISNDSAANKSFKRLIGQNKGVKALLLDQKAIVSGVGNWIADEVLYQSKLHPDQDQLTVEEVELLKKKLIFILNTGNQCLQNSRQFPEDWIFHRRWSKKSSTAPKDANGKSVSFLKSGGRTSCIVSSIQKKYSRKSKPTQKTRKKIMNLKRKTKSNEEKEVLDNHNDSSHNKKHLRRSSRLSNKK